MRKTHDYTHHYHGFWRPGGICHIEIYEAAEQPPIIVCSELPENENTSITNMVEYLCAEVMRAHFSRLFEAIAPPIVWIEHYSPDRCDPHDRYALVTFDSYTPRQVWRASGLRRLRLGEPEWRHLTRAEVQALLGRATVQPQDIPANPVPPRAKEDLP